MASTASLFFVVVIGFVVLPSVIESLPLSAEDDAVGHQQTNDLGNQESEEIAGQTDGAEQNTDSSEEVVIDAGNTGSSVAGFPVNPAPPGPVGPGRGAPADIPKYHPVEVPKYPDIGPANPVGNPLNPPLIPPPAPTEWPAAVPLTTRQRGDGGLGSFNPRMNGAGAKPRPDVKPRAKAPTISNNIAHISQDKPNAPRRQPIPFPAIITVVVIGGVVVVTAVGGVAYYVATRVRIS